MSNVVSLGDAAFLLFFLVLYVTPYRLLTAESWLPESSALGEFYLGSKRRAPSIPLGSKEGGAGRSGGRFSDCIHSALEEVKAKFIALSKHAAAAF